MASPRVLTLSFEFHVPEGLSANIRAARIETAVASMTSAIQALAARVFPWADRIEVRKQWAYVWSSEAETLALPRTDANTVAGPTESDENPDQSPEEDL